jgi:hypothetical protein
LFQTRQVKRKIPTTKSISPIDISSESRENDIKQPIVSVTEYRRILQDQESTDTQIVKRLRHLEALSRNVIKMEIENYVNKKN